MAITTEAIALLSVLGLIHCMPTVANVCNVSCTTNYISRINCSNARWEPAASCHVEVECRNWYDQINRSCVIGGPDDWCAVDDFDIMMAIDTNCTTRVHQLHPTPTPTPTLTETHWPLKNFIKPEPPFNVTLEESNSDFNLSWSMVYTEDHFLHDFLIYRVRLRPLSTKDSIYYEVPENCQTRIIPKDSLAKGETYVIDVQAMSTFEEVWSEWSPSAKLVTKGFFGVSKTQDWYSLLIPTLIVIVLVLICAKKWTNKFQFNSIPSPKNFFTPLYHTYEGTLRWVGPVFILSSFDLQEKSTSLKVTYDKKVTGSIPKPLAKNPSDLRPCSNGLDPSPLLFLPDSLGLLGNSMVGGSGQHISIATVTVSEEEEEERVPNPAAAVAVVDGEMGVVIIADGNSDSDERRWPNDHEDLTESISLDSYRSLYSEDGYPRVTLDLDTVDSGFLESDCGSPVFDRNEQLEMELFHVREPASHSNYVKQWRVHPGL